MVVVGSRTQDPMAGQEIQQLERIFNGDEEEIR
jgi:hypothetical protein